MNAPILSSYLQRITHLETINLHRDVILKAIAEIQERLQRTYRSKLFKYINQKYGVPHSDTEICLERLIICGDIKIVKHKDGESYWNSKDICLTTPNKPTFSIQQFYLLYSPLPANPEHLEEVDFHREKLLEAVNGRWVDIQFIVKFLCDHYNISLTDTEICLHHLLAREVLIAVYYNGIIVYKNPRDRNFYGETKLNNPIVSQALKDALQCLSATNGYRTFTSYEISRTLRMFISVVLNSEKVISESQMPRELSGNELVLSLDREAMYGKITKVDNVSYGLEGINFTYQGYCSINPNLNEIGANQNMPSSSTSLAAKLSDIYDATRQGQTTTLADALQSSTHFFANQKSHTSTIPAVNSNQFSFLPCLNPNNSYVFHDGVNECRMQPSLSQTFFGLPYSHPNPLTQTVIDQYSNFNYEQKAAYEGNTTQFPLDTNNEDQLTTINEGNDSAIPPTINMVMSTESLRNCQLESEIMQDQGKGELSRSREMTQLANVENDKRTSMHSFQKQNVQSGEFSERFQDVNKELGPTAISYNTISSDLTGCPMEFSNERNLTSFDVQDEELKVLFDNLEKNITVSQQNVSKN
ncbi:unnamed protein product [Hymenolepis diminuta]|uniref:HTH OST-type domain-containing protein n=1 Tax=Hymenolepis diminuta TaxID=6216 RepID=A0A0R3SXY3_HYMDI|nr:unnamed protein product [Hymenolepis diminuta]VUZ39143.1 unnamed protein product [Hymenolepis diminuta]